MNRSAQRYGKFAAASGFVAVALGAFGSHGLKGGITEADLAIWQTAVQYQMFHTLALLLVALVANFRECRWLARAAQSLSVGIIVFSGSLYLLVLTDMRWLGAITPLGGIAYLCGWFALFMALRVQFTATDTYQ